MAGSFTLIALGVVSLVAIAALLGCVYIYFKHQSLQEEFLISRNVQLRPSDVYRMMGRKPSPIESTLGNVLKATVNGGDTVAEPQSEPQSEPQPEQQPEQQPEAQSEEAQDEDQVSETPIASFLSGDSEVVSDAESVTEVASKPRRRNARKKTADVKP